MNRPIRRMAKALAATLAIGAGSAAFAEASSEGLANLTFPAVNDSWVWDNDLAGKTLGTVTLAAGAKADLSNGTIETKLVLGEGAEATVANAMKANVAAIDALAGIAGETATVYFNAGWADALTRAGAPGQEPATLELRGLFDDATMGEVTLALTNSVAVDNAYLTTPYADDNVTAAEGTRARKTADGTAVTYTALYDIGALVEAGTLVVADVPDQVYTGMALTPVPAVTYNGEPVAADEFTYAYENNTDKTPEGATDEQKASVTLGAADGGCFAYFDGAEDIARLFSIVASSAENPAVVTLPDPSLVPGDDPDNPATIEDILKNLGEDAVVEIVLTNDMHETIVVPDNIAAITIDLAGYTLSPSDGEDVAVKADNAEVAQSVTILDSGRTEGGETVYGKVDGDVETDANDALVLNNADVGGTVDADGTALVENGSEVDKIAGDGTFTLKSGKEDGDAAGDGTTQVKDITDIADTAKIVSGDAPTSVVDGVSVGGGIVLKDPETGVVTSDTTLEYAESKTGDEVTGITYLYYNQTDVNKIAQILNPVLTEGKIKVKAAVK